MRGSVGIWGTRRNGDNKLLSEFEGRPYFAGAPSTMRRLDRLRGRRQTVRAVFTATPPHMKSRGITINFYTLDREAHTGKISQHSQRRMYA